MRLLWCMIWLAMCTAADVIQKKKSDHFQMTKRSDYIAEEMWAGWCYYLMSVLVTLILIFLPFSLMRFFDVIGSFSIKKKVAAFTKEQGNLVFSLSILCPCARSTTGSEAGAADTGGFHLLWSGVSLPWNVRWVSLKSKSRTSFCSRIFAGNLKWILLAWWSKVGGLSAHSLSCAASWCLTSLL